jgi:hypothetical protein
MLLPEVHSTMTETTVIERPVLNAGNDDSHNGISILVGREVDDDDLIESAGSESLQ